MKQRKYKAISQSDFNLIKELRKAGVTMKQIADLTGRSTNVIVCVGQAKDLNEYQEIRQRRRSKARSAQDQAEDKTRKYNLDMGTFEQIIDVNQATSLSYGQIGKLVGRSPTTIARVIQAGTWDKYEDFKEEVAQKQRERYEHQPVVTITNPAVIAEEVEAIEPTPATQPAVETGQDLTDGLEDIVNSWRLSSAQLEERLRQLGY